MKKYLHLPTKTSHIYECPYCNYKASNTLGIRLHMKITHKTKSFELSKDFLCELCGKNSL